jgi:PAS domain S-box-containing protein
MQMVPFSVNDLAGNDNLRTATDEARPPCLLIVEDEIIIATGIRMSLIQLGYQVTGIAATGEEALELAARIRPDLVLMDIGLQGGMDGIEVAREMRGRLRLPVVFLTAYAETATLQRAIEAEPLGYLLKPFQDHELKIVIEMALYKHRAERHLQDSEEVVRKLKVALDEHAIVAITDAQGKISYVNDKFCAISKYAREELIGHDHRILNSGYHPPEFFRDLWQTIGGGHVWKGEIRNRAKDGSLYWVSATIVPFLDPDGKPTQFVAIRTDITGLKQAEDEIRHLNTTLDQRVKERTEQLETAVQELDSFSYSVSHDLRAPLRAVDGFARLLSHDYAPLLGSEGVRMLDVIRSETHRMSRLIDDLLAFSRLGRQQIEQESIDMHTLAQSVFDELAALEPSRPLRLNLHSLPPACGTQAMIRQVWANLIGNAIKFTHGREPAEIEIGAQDGGEGTQIYYVKDNGAGFDMRYQDKLFGVFQRLHTQAEFPGTGVGLALVQRIVKRHGGRVWAEAEVDLGARFFFTLTKVKS